MENKKAKQFVPFDALEGYRDEIKKRDIIKISKPSLSEEQMLMINDVLNKLKKNDLVKITYYKNGQILTMIGLVRLIDSINKFIKIDNYKINFEDLLNLEEGCD